MIHPVIDDVITIQYLRKNRNCVQSSIRNHRNQSKGHWRTYEPRCGGLILCATRCVFRRLNVSAPLISTGLLNADVTMESSNSAIPEGAKNPYAHTCCVPDEPWLPDLNLNDRIARM